MEIISTPQTKKNVLILTGIHGDELTPVYTVIKYKDEIIKNEKCNVNIINGVNKSALKNCSREFIDSKNDTKDLNRAFFEKESENFNDIVDNIGGFIRDSDFVIDIHCSHNADLFLLININEYTECFIELANKLNIKYALRYSNTNTIKKYCLDKNIPAITIECNGMNVFDKEMSLKLVDALKHLLNVIPDFEMKKSCATFEEHTVIKTFKEGVFIPNIKYTEGTIPKDIIIGSIYGLDGNKIIDISTPITGYPIILTDRSYVNESDVVCLFQKI